MLNFTSSLAPPSGKIWNQIACFPSVLDFLNNFAADSEFLSYVDHKIALA